MNSIEIMLVCSAGMSTSILVSAMKKAIKSREINANVFAKPSTEAMEYVETNDVSVVLLGPHVRFFEEEYKKPLEMRNIPITTIDSRDYGMMNGEKVLQTALELIKG